MSNLLEQASLVLIPSGYKEDVVYSEIPLDGSGDLQFTRSSDGTRINSAGLVEVCPWNLVEQSETFTNAFWSVDNGTITANSTTAPNGTTTADTFTRNASTAYLYNGSFNLGIGQFTQSIYAKANASSSIRLEFVTSAFGNGAACIFDLSNGTAGSITIYGGVSGFTATIENVGNGWYRCSIGGTLTIADTYYYEISITTGSIYIWGAQLNIGSTAKPYFPTTDRLNVPRLTYQNGGGGCPSLLLEKQSTNFQTYSQDFTNAAWTKLGQGVGDTSVVTANYAISPDGTQNATRFVCNLNGGTTSSDRSWMIASFTAQATSTISIWIKLNSAGTKTVLLSDSGGGTKTISGTEWQRIDATFVGAGGEFRIGLIGGSTSDTLDCCIWGAQAESGTYPTSYIPTTSASATRVADACYKTGISSLIGQTEGVLFADVNWIVKPESGSPVVGILTINNNVANLDNCIILGIERQTGGGNRVYCLVQNAGSTEAGLFGSLISSGRYKIALAYKANDFVLYVNGVQIATDTSGSVPTTSEVLLGQRFTGDSVNLNDSINEAVVFKTRLTNAELASLTTI